MYILINPDAKVHSFWKITALKFNFTLIKSYQMTKCKHIGKKLFNIAYTMT